MTKIDGIPAETGGFSPSIASKRRRSDLDVRSSEPQIGRALRSVYDQTVSEAIPSDLLDLLGRLD